MEILQEKNTTTAQNVPEQTTKQFIKELLFLAILSLLIVIPIRGFIAQPFIVDGPSMNPTFATSQYLIVDEFSYRFESPSRGDVIVFKYPKDQTKSFIKRVIGLPGETVEVLPDKFLIKNKAHPEGFTIPEPYIDAPVAYRGNVTLTLSADEYFVMGDNRDQSFDSRAWGAVRRGLITGRPFLRLFPFDKIGVFPGRFIEPSGTGA
jgi:signal peptidase I